MINAHTSRTLTFSSPHPLDESEVPAVLITAVHVPVVVRLHEELDGRRPASFIVFVVAAAAIAADSADAVVASFAPPLLPTR